MVDGKKLKKIVIQILKKRGLSLPHASISADALINAEYVGAYGHGISVSYTHLTLPTTEYV